MFNGESTIEVSMIYLIAISLENGDIFPQGNTN